MFLSEIDSDGPSKITTGQAFSLLSLERYTHTGQAESLPYNSKEHKGKHALAPATLAIHAPAATGTPMCSMIASAKPEHFTRVAPSISRSKS